MLKFFAFLEVDPEKIYRAEDAINSLDLQEIEELECYKIMGPYDIVIVASCTNIDGMAKITNSILEIDGIETATTVPVKQERA